MKTYIHGTNSLILELWKKMGIPSGTYFGVLESEKGKKEIPKGINPVVDATFRNTSLDREDVFDKICEVYDKLGVPLPDNGLELYENPVVVYIKGNGEFKKDSRANYMALSPEIHKKDIGILKIDPKSNYRERAGLIKENGSSGLVRKMSLN